MLLVSQRSQSYWEPEKIDAVIDDPIEASDLFLSKLLTKMEKYVFLQF